MILFLLDTGLRASELCHLKIGEVDMRTGRITVKHGDEGGAKEEKADLYLSARALAGWFGVTW